MFLAYIKLWLLDFFASPLIYSRKKKYRGGRKKNLSSLLAVCFPNFNKTSSLEHKLCLVSSCRESLSPIKKKDRIFYMLDSRHWCLLTRGTSLASACRTLTEDLASLHYVNALEVASQAPASYVWVSQNDACTLNINWRKLEGPDMHFQKNYYLCSQR